MGRPFAPEPTRGGAAYLSVCFGAKISNCHSNANSFLKRKGIRLQHSTRRGNPNGSTVGSRTKWRAAWVALCFGRRIKGNRGIYSLIKHNGLPLYHSTRKGGPPPRYGPKMSEEEAVDVLGAFYAGERVEKRKVVRAMTRLPEAARCVLGAGKCEEVCPVCDELDCDKHSCEESIQSAFRPARGGGP